MVNVQEITEEPIIKKKKEAESQGYARGDPITPVGRIPKNHFTQLFRTS